MTYYQLFTKAENLFINSKITFSEYERMIEPLNNELPKVSEWEQVEVFEVEGTTVDRLQSTYCPVCNTYHTTPYVYCYNHYNYCPNCGTQMKMKGASDEFNTKRF